MKQFLLINGCSCAGKSTIIEALMERQPDMYHLSYDRQKWSFSQYTNHKESYKPIISHLVHTIAHEMCREGYTVITDSVIEREMRQSLTTIALNHGYTPIEINIEADWEVIESRFVERLQRTETHKHMKVANTSVEKLRSLYLLYEQEKNPDAKTFRSDICPIPELIDNITSYIQSV